MKAPARTIVSQLVTAAFVIGQLALSSPAHAAAATVANGVATSDLNAIGVTATGLAQSLAGTGVSVSNVTYKGANAQLGHIQIADPAVVSFNDGVILSSGNIADVAGPNKSDSTTGDMASSIGIDSGAADADLTALIAGAQTVNPMTYDAAVLEFDFVPTTNSVYFTYTFGSDEYLEWVNLYDDVFAFYVNGTNCATVPVGANTADGTAVSINTINDVVNPSLFRDNAFSTPVANPINIEPDGLSVEMICTASVNQGVTNHMKLAIADTSDQVLDTVVMIKAGSLSTTKPESCNDNVDNDDDQLVDMNDDSCTSTTTAAPAGTSGIGNTTPQGSPPPVFDPQGVNTVAPVYKGAPAFTGNEGTAILLDAAALGWTTKGLAIKTSWTVTGINGLVADCTILSGNNAPIVGGEIELAYALCPTDGEYVARVDGTDAEGGSEFDYDVDFFVHNAPPTISLDGIANGSQLDISNLVSVSAAVTDSGAGDSVSCVVNWGDGASAPATFDNGVCTASYTYSPVSAAVTAGDKVIISMTATDSANLSSVAAAFVTLVDGPITNLLPQTISVATEAPGSAIYGESFTVEATGDASGNPLVYAASGGCTNIDGTFTMTSGITACVVTIDQAGDATYDAATQVQFTVTAERVEITVTANPASKYVGGQDSILSYDITVGALVTGDELTGSLEREVGETPGDYLISQGTVAANENYILNYQDANFTINETGSGLLPGEGDFAVPVELAFGKTFNLAATGALTSSIPEFSVAGDCELTGTTVTATAAFSSCDITLFIAGDDTYDDFTLTQTVDLIAADFARTTKPIITGTATSLKTLSVGAITWPTDTEVSYQWLRDGVEINGAIGATYLLTSQDVGHKISVQVIATNANFNDYDMTSNATAKVAPLKPTLAKLATSKHKVGSSFTISGTNFQQVISVKIAGKYSAKFVIVSATKLKITVPKGAKTGKITVLTAGGSVTSSSNAKIG